MEAEKTKTRRTRDIAESGQGTIVLSVLRPPPEGSVKRLLKRIAAQSVAARSSGSVRSVVHISSSFSRRETVQVGGWRPPYKEVDPRERATELGAAPGEPVSPSAAKAILERIAEDASDLFLKPARAAEFLGTTNFAGTGKRAVDLVKAGAAATVIARLDELRFGSQG